MMLRRFFIAVFLLAVTGAYAQADTTFSNRYGATGQILNLKTGALVVRLKTSDKSVEAYRQAGKSELADKIANERLMQNQKLVAAFKRHFNFCKVYFIYAKNTAKFMETKRGYFLNDTLGVDTTLHLKEKFFLIAEYGDISSNAVSDPYHYSGTNKTEASTTPASSSVIFVSDTNLVQLKEPFPFYESVYLDNYDKAVERFNKGLYKFYYSTMEKANRRKLKEQ